ncbi:MAG TPA: hypothetical protein VK673_02060 [Chthoniobacterales bacterium]|nr:hypothetical protein [Chthoniobacterales bacterium]
MIVIGQIDAILALLGMAIPESEPVDAFLLSLRSATSDQATRILRKTIARDP